MVRKRIVGRRGMFHTIERRKERDQRSRASYGNPRTLLGKSRSEAGELDRVAQALFGYQQN